MKALKTDIDGVVIVEPKVFTDVRGVFFESYSKQLFDAAIGREIDFVQDNESQSKRNVIRGLHFQMPPFAQAKLVRCVHGKIVDVALDLRKDSKTFGKHVAVELSDDNHRAIFIPAGFAHGFSVVSDYAVVQYKCDKYYNPEAEGGVSALDPSLGIDWGISLQDAIISDKDKRLPLMNQLKSCF